MPTRRESIETLEEFIVRFKGTDAEAVKPLKIPGYDSYAPSYLADGTSAEKNNDGELESDTRRNQQVL